MLWFFLFVFGLAIGSFLNVVALRYDGEHFLFSADMLGGRSHCPHCKKTLRWFELVPLLSFVIQGGKCRGCKARISIQYPIVELLSGFVFLFVPLRAMMLYPNSGGFYTLCMFLIILFELLLLMSVIDIRMGIIPDELNIALAALGIFFGLFLTAALGTSAGGVDSLIGPFASVFGNPANLLVSRVIGALAGGAFFWFLVWVSPRIFHQEGMGMGDVKLAAALGFFFGWPDILLITIFAFVIGAIIGVLTIALGKKTMKATLPFGPFLAVGACAVFFFGFELFTWYFSLLGLR